MNNNLLNYMGWQYVLVHVDENRPLSALQDELQITYNHLSKIIRELQNAGYLDIAKTGRKLIIKHTEEGLKQKHNLQNSMLASQGLDVNIFPVAYDFVDDE